MNREIITIYVHVLKHNLTPRQYYSWMDACLNTCKSLNSPEELTYREYQDSILKHYII